MLLPSLLAGRRRLASNLRHWCTALMLFAAFASVGVIAKDVAHQCPPPRAPARFCVQCLAGFDAAAELHGYRSKRGKEKVRKISGPMVKVER